MSTEEYQHANTREKKRRREVSRGTFPKPGRKKEGRRWGRHYRCRSSIEVQVGGIEMRGKTQALRGAVNRGQGAQKGGKSRLVS